MIDCNVNNHQPWSDLIKRLLEVIIPRSILLIDKSKEEEEESKGDSMTFGEWETKNSRPMVEDDSDHSDEETVNIIGICISATTSM
jgi:hypothetical protein